MGSIRKSICKEDIDDSGGLIKVRAEQRDEGEREEGQEVREAEKKEVLCEENLCCSIIHAPVAFNHISAACIAINLPKIKGR